VPERWTLGIITFMDDKNMQLQQEVQELRAEVRRLRYLIEGAILIISIGLVVLIPNLLVIGISLGVLILFGFLVSRQRRMIFHSLFRKRETHEHDA
jgi:hypothetical protein